MTLANELRTKSAFEIGRLIRDKQISSPEVTRVFLDAAKADFSKAVGADDKINAFTDLTEEYAMHRAEEIQKQIETGENLSPFSGVPVAIKDCICTTNGTTTASSKILEGYVSPYDAEVVRRLNAAGTVMIGKVNMDEFAMGGSTETSHYGITRNPWDLSRVPGGSSGGSAASVAAGFAAFALGSDTGGSIRQPCSFNNLTGVKPTYGSVSRYGLMAYGSSLDQIGPLCHDVRDAAAVLSIISGPDKRDSTNIMDESFELCSVIHHFENVADKPLKGLKIGLPTNYLEMDGLAHDVRETIIQARNKYKELGAEIIDFELPLIDYAVPTYLIVSAAEASSNLSRYDGVKYGYRADGDDLLDVYYNTRSEGFGTEVKRRIMLGSFVLSSGYFDAYYKKALKVRALIKQAFDEALSKVDVILSPVCPTEAYEIGGQIKDPIAMYLGDIYTTSVNLTGLPAVSLPAGFSNNNLPIGMQLIGKTLSEEKLLGVAAEFQKVTDYHKKRAF